MQELTKKAITGLIWLQILMALMPFAPAWALHFWEAWAFWLLFSALSGAVTLHFRSEIGSFPQRAKRALDALCDANMLKAVSIHGQSTPFADRSSRPGR